MTLVRLIDLLIDYVKRLWNKMSKQVAKQKIIHAFKKNVEGTSPSSQELNANHDGAEGHWLETKLGKKPDASNEADFWGYECKNDTTSKTTWGDWTGNYRIYHDKNFFTLTKNSDNQDEFVRIFGKKNPNKKNRSSWSGSPVPTRIGDKTSFGQRMEIDSEGNIVIFYSFSEDTRKNKSSLIPIIMQKDNLVLMKWYGTESSFESYKAITENDNNIFFQSHTQASLEHKVVNKFGEYGWFKCLKDSQGNFDRIEFGDSLTYLEWLSHVKNGDIYFDTGMYEGNIRPYCQWRSNNKFWKSLVTSKYP